jgi:hypothetical protein
MQKKLKIPTSVPESEMNTEFLQGMIDRRAVGYHKYGSAFNKKSDYLRDIGLRVSKYINTGNTEWLMDVAVFAWLEFQRPSVEDAHFRATDSNESPGVFRKGELDPTQRHVNEF